MREDPLLDLAENLVYTTQTDYWDEDGYDHSGWSELGRTIEEMKSFSKEIPNWEEIIEEYRRLEYLYNEQFDAHRRLKMQAHILLYEHFLSLYEERKIQREEEEVREQKRNLLRKELEKLG